MRTIETVVYLFDELPSEKAKEKARAWMREGEDFDYLGQEVKDTLKGFEKAFSCKARDWEYGDCRSAYVKLDAPDLEDEETVAEFIKSHLPTEDCPFTGCCYDEDVLEPLRGKDLSNCTDLKALLTDCVLNLFKAAVEEMRYRMTDESIDENIRINEHEFTIDGKIS